MLLLPCGVDGWLRSARRSPVPVFWSAVAAWIHAGGHRSRGWPDPGGDRGDRRCSPGRGPAQRGHQVRPAGRGSTGRGGGVQRGRSGRRAPREARTRVGVMVAIPLYLAVAQWALLGALGVLVIVMFRQLGQLIKGDAKAEEFGPRVGSLAVPLTYKRPGEREVRTLTPGHGQPALIAFVDPTCPSCEELVLTLDAMRAAGEL